MLRGRALKNDPCWPSYLSENTVQLAFLFLHLKIELKLFFFKPVLKESLSDLPVGNFFLIKEREPLIKLMPS